MGGSSCGDCGPNGEGWCHKSASNCAACAGSFGSSASAPSCSGSPSPPPPSTSAPAPVGPGLCCYGGCGGGNCQGGWCGESQGNCEGNCNGEFCPAAAALASPSARLRPNRV